LSASSCIGTTPESAFFRQVFHRQDFCARTVRLVRSFAAGIFSICSGDGGRPVRAQGLDSGEYRCRRFARNRLVNNRFHKHLVWGLGVCNVNLKGNGFRNQSAQRFIVLGKMTYSLVEFKSKVGLVEY